MITAFRANTPLMIFRQTSLVSNSYGSTTVTAPPCTAGSLRLTSGAGTALELGRPKSATLSESRQGLVVLAHREWQHHSPVDREARVQTRERLIHISLVAILSFSDITVEFGATTLLSGVTFTVAAGERWGIVGRNGAGKTTLFRLIDGSLMPARGAIVRQPGLGMAAPVDLVLLDEPTNHLDLETIEWLKRYLGEFGETLIVISHDRAFLDDTVDHMLHVAGRTTTAYRGGYTAFVTQRAERHVALER